MKELIAKIKSGQDLTEPQAEHAFKQIMSGLIEDDQIRQFLTALKEKAK